MTAHVLIEIIGFGIVAIASLQIAGYLKKFRLPLVTGMIVTGIIAGSSLLNFITREALQQLQFLNEIALAIIAFSAGSELYLKELRSRMRSIKWMVIGQIVATFGLSIIAVFYLSELIPFMKDMPISVKWAIASLFGIVFVARSPSSIIAIINETRANGPFTKTAIGTTVVKDVVVIVLFTFCLTIAEAVIIGKAIDFLFVVILIIELLLSFLMGVVLSRLLLFPFLFGMHRYVKGFLLILIGYGIFYLSSYIKHQSMGWIGYEISIEPLLICILGSFLVTNFSKHRIEFADLLHKIGPMVFVVFFTLAGVSFSLQVFTSVAGIALLFFFIRLFTLFVGSYLGVVMARDNKEYRFIAWMPYITQAGVALGLTTIITKTFPTWGLEFETIVIGIVVINQLIGDIFFKWAIHHVKESRVRHAEPGYDGIKDAYIFGLEPQSVALAKQLQSNRWQAKIFTLDHEKDIVKDPDLDIVSISGLSLEELDKLNMEKADAIVCMLSDVENYTLAEMIYEHVGTKDVIIRLNDRKNMERFHNLGVLIIDPSTAMVGLLDHFVRSPNATSLLLGMDKSQDTQDIEITNRDIHGMTLRDLRLPTDVIILSVKRKGQMIISHGYTRLRLKDIVTMVGSPKSLEVVRSKFSGF